MGMLPFVAVASDNFPYLIKNLANSLIYKGYGAINFHL